MVEKGTKTLNKDWKGTKSLKLLLLFQVLGTLLGRIGTKIRLKGTKTPSSSILIDNLFLRSHRRFFTCYVVECARVNKNRTPPLPSGRLCTSTHIFFKFGIFSPQNLRGGVAPLLNLPEGEGQSVHPPLWPPLFKYSAFLKFMVCWSLWYIWLIV